MYNIFNTLNKDKINDKKKSKGMLSRLNKVNKVGKKISTLLLIFIILFSSMQINVVALEKPIYVDWLRELYEYDDSVSDEQIRKVKMFEDETGRVFYKNPTGLSYDAYDGIAEVISTLRGYLFNNDFSIDIGQFDITCKDGSVNIIYYNQGDYRNIRYGSSNLAASGCGVVSMLMVINSLTNANLTPEQMAAWAMQNGYRVENAGSKWSIVSGAAKDFGLNCNPMARTDRSGVISALEKGDPVVMICGPGDFTTFGHFMVLTGIDKDGYVTINDPGSRARTAKKWPINTIMRNASLKQGAGANTFWHISR